MLGHPAPRRAEACRTAPAESHLWRPGVQKTVADDEDAGEVFGARPGGDTQRVCRNFARSSLAPTSGLKARNGGTFGPRPQTPETPTGWGYVGS
jgi:hypothetical protein